MYHKIKYTLKLLFFKKKWRKLNPHNLTTAKNIFNPDIIKIGRETYGPLHVYEWGASNEELEIGNFVSIANDVKFILGGNHYYNTFSTYPFKVQLLNEETEAYSNGKIVVNDDVWIGMNCIILSGVEIGQGAIIAAGSVVTKDVAPYSIVGGSPAKHIKFRFEEKIIKQLLNVKFDNLDINYIKNNIHLFYEPLSVESCKGIIDKVSNK